MWALIRVPQVRRQHRKWVCEEVSHYDALDSCHLEGPVQQNKRTLERLSNLEPLYNHKAVHPLHIPIVEGIHRPQPQCMWATNHTPSKDYRLNFTLQFYTSQAQFKKEKLRTCFLREPSMIISILSFRSAKLVWVKEIWLLNSFKTIEWQLVRVLLI